MPIPFDQNCSVKEYLQQLIDDYSGQISAIAISVSYENAQRENFHAFADNQESRLISLLPLLQDTLNKIELLALAEYDQKTL